MPALGRLQQGTTESQEWGTYSFAGGLNVRNFRSQQLLGDNDLMQAYNGYITTGGFSMRNGMSVYQASIVSGANTCLGVARFFQQVVNGSSVAVSPVTLAQVLGELYNADTPVAIGSIGGTGAFPMTWVRCQDPNDPNYTSGNTDVIVICTGVNGPYVYDGTNLYTPAGWSAASGARWCSIVNGIVWFGGIPAYPRTIYGTGDGINASFETLPGYNEFVMSQPVTGLCALGTGAVASLAIGQNNGLSILFGTSPFNFSLQDVPFFFDGPVSGRAMVYEAGIMYFLGKQAMYAFDGSQVVPISVKVEPWILNDGYVSGYPMSGDRTKSFAFIYNNRLHVGYINGPGSAPNTILVYDLVVQGWTVLQTTPGVYCAAALDAPTDSAPTKIIVGSSSGPVVYNWDVEPAIGSVALDGTSAITCTMQTKPFKIGAPGTTKVLTRTYPEFLLNGPISGTQTISIDYGTSTSSQTFGQTALTQGAFIAPGSRIDWDGVQGDAFSFQVQTTGNSSPWTLTGLTAVWQQRGRASAA